MTDIEKLIAAYEAAVVDPLFDAEKAARLCRAVEAEADRVGYQDHARLMSLHTMHEQAALAAENGGR